MSRALLLLLCCACGTSRPAGGPGDAGPVDFTIGSIALHAGSGAAVQSAGLLRLYLSDQPDTCAAIHAVPVMTATTFSLRITPPSDTTGRATVVPPKATPAAGEATGAIAVATGGVKKDGADATDGSVSWAVNTDGSVTLTSIDVGFAGASGRLATHGLLLAACAP